MTRSMSPSLWPSPATTSDSSLGSISSGESTHPNSHDLINLNRTIEILGGKKIIMDLIKSKNAEIREKALVAI